MRKVDYVEFVGQHPMTAHHPHYRNIYSSLPEGLEFNFIKNASTLVNHKYDSYINNLTTTARQIGATQEAIDYFISAIHHGCKYYIAENTKAFIPTLGYFGPENHFINLEDWSSLFTFLLHGHTHSIDILEQSFTKVMIAHLLQDNCLGIFSHIHNTIDTFLTITQDFPEISHKFIYLPLAAPQDTFNHPANKSLNEKVRFLFTNSFGGQHGNFLIRGGEASLEAFIRLAKKYNNVELTIVGPCPKRIDHPRIRLFNQHVDDATFRSIIETSDIFLIPASHIHTISLVTCLSNSIIPVVSDGWAFNEYIKDGYNGFIAKGQEGFTTWLDKNGIFVENYDAATPLLEDNVYEKMVSIVEQIDMIPTWRKNCYEYAVENFNINRRNSILEKYL